MQTILMEPQRISASLAEQAGSEGSVTLDKCGGFVVY